MTANARRTQAALFDDLAAFEPMHVLDVGCGTGKAAWLWQGAACLSSAWTRTSGWLTLPRDRGIAVEIAAFETWRTPGGNST